MVAGQSYTTTWATTNATGTTLNCTSTGSGYTTNGTTSGNPNGFSSGIALAAWVGYPSNCLWTATGPGGTVTYQDPLNTVAGGSGPTLTVTRSPNPMVAGQAYTQSWSTSGAVSLTYGCTGTGYNTGGLETMYPMPSGSRQQTAYWGQVGNAGTCTWTAKDANGATKVVTEQLTTVAP
jgi:hypothetical protein